MSGEKGAGQGEVDILFAGEDGGEGKRNSSIGKRALTEKERSADKKRAQEEENL